MFLTLIFFIALSAVLLALLLLERRSLGKLRDDLGAVNHSDEQAPVRAGARALP